MPQYSSGRWLVGISAVVVGLALVSVLVTLIAGGNDPARLEPGSPEEAVQRYLLAVKDRDFATAYAVLGPDLTANCSLADFLAAAHYDNTQDIRVRLEDSLLVDANNARVQVRITQFYGSAPFEMSESTFPSTYVLSKQDGQWRFAEAPWPYYGCAYRPIESKPTPTPTPTPEAAAAP